LINTIRDDNRNVTISHEQKSRVFRKSVGFSYITSFIQVDRNLVGRNVIVLISQSGQVI